MLLTVAVALILHFIADFILQSNEMAIKKSQEPLVLLKHCGIHLGVFFFGFVLLHGLIGAFLIALANAALHAVIDWNVWRAYKRWVQKKYPGMTTQEQVMKDDSARHWFFVTIGFDQLLHGLSIILAIFLLGEI